MPDHDLEEDLEATGAEPVGVDLLAAHDEEAAHRVAHTCERTGEHHFRGEGRRTGDHGSAERQSAVVAVTHVAGCAHQARARLLASGDHFGNEFGRMLQVAVHDAHPIAARVP